MHLIRLINATFFAHHGVSTEEKRTGGRYEVDVEVMLDFEAAAREDDLNQTVCYETIYQVAEQVIMGGKFDLIERVAYLIANEVRKLSAQIQYVEVSVRKQNPPVKGTVDYAEVTYRSDVLKGD